MATAKIKRGDTVKVIAGKDKGKEGKVVSVSDGRLVGISGESAGWYYSQGRTD